MIIGVISDTHGLLRPEAEGRLAGVDHIIHAGDLGDPEIVPRLRAIAPTTVIRGNVDTQEWAREFPDWETVTLAGRLIYVLHDLGDLNLDPVTAGFDIVISGHSHRPRVGTIDGVLYLNPGSAGPRRFRLPITLATIALTEAEMRPEIHVLFDRGERRPKLSRPAVSPAVTDYGDHGSLHALRDTGVEIDRFRALAR